MLRPRLLLALEFLLYALLTAVALRATWLTWPDAFIDFSREVYLPWRVSQGDVLYRDLAYYFGPLSVYLNAALFALLGHPSIHALFALNFVLWLATLLALRALLRRIVPPSAATVCISLFILLFSFNRYIPCGNFNYLAPYSHELPRGFLLALLALLSLDSALKKASLWLSCLSGFLLGLALFTKPEIALAASISAAVLSFFWVRGRPARDGGSGAKPPPVWAFALGILAAIALVVTPFAIAFSSVSQALRDCLFKLFLDCFDTALTSIPFFRTTTGMDAPLANLLRLVAGGLLAACPFLLLRFLRPRISRHSFRSACIILLALLAAAIGFRGFFPLNAALPLAPVLFAAFFPGKRNCPGRNGDSESTDNYPLVTGHFNPPLAIAFAVFAFVLVSKMLLNASVAFYGFVLALPAFCCAVLFLLGPAPGKRAAQKPGRFSSPALARALLASALLLGFGGAALRLQSSVLRHEDIRQPVFDDSFLAPSRQAEAFNAVLGWIRANTDRDSTLAVLPEGAILNVISGRQAPNPFFMLEQGTYLRGDASTILAAYSNAPPDTLVLVQTAPPRFGIDYATGLMAFLAPLYEPAFAALSVPTPAGPVPYLLVATRISGSDPMTAVP